MAARSEALTPKPPSRPKPFYTSRRFRKAIAIRTRAPDAEAGAAAIRGEIDATLGAELAVRHHLHRCVDNFVAGLEQVAAVLREQRHPLGKTSPDRRSSHRAWNWRSSPSRQGRKQAPSPVSCGQAALG